MIQCSKCQGELGKTEHAASISGSILGDECIDSYYFCNQCGVYTVEIYWDMFSGGESESASGPISKTEGDTAVGLIRQCSTPWEKKCRCSAHLSYFENSALD